MQIKSELRAPFTSHKRQTEWKREGTGEHDRKVDEWGGNLGNWVSVVAAAAAGERSLNRGINEQRCSPFIYFPALATWDSSKPFLQLFRRFLRCSGPFVSSDWHSGGAEGKRARPDLHLCCGHGCSNNISSSYPLFTTVAEASCANCLLERTSLPPQVGVTPSLVRLAPALSEMEIKEWKQHLCLVWVRGRGLAPQSDKVVRRTVQENKP